MDNAIEDLTDWDVLDRVQSFEDSERVMLLSALPPGSTSVADDDDNDDDDLLEEVDYE